MRTSEAYKTTPFGVIARMRASWLNNIPLNGLVICRMISSWAMERNIAITFWAGMPFENITGTPVANDGK